MVGVEVKAFKMVCLICESTQFSISEPGLGRPKEWGPEVLGVADCRGCQQVFLVKLPEELAWLLYRRIASQAFSASPAELAIAIRKALGLQ